MKNLGSGQIKNRFAEVLNRVEFRGETVVITRHRRHCAVIVSRDVLVELFGYVAELEARMAAFGGDKHPASEKIAEIKERITYSTWYGVKS